MPGLLLQPSTNYERALLQEALSELHWTASDEYYIVQWCKARDIDWQRVLRGEICANSLLVRTAVTRKVRGCFSLELFDDQTAPIHEAGRHTKCI